MKKETVLFLAGFAAGIGVSLVLYKNREQIKQKLDELENKLNIIELKENIKETIYETIYYLKQIVNNQEQAENQDQNEVLNIVEEKIKKLEQIIKR